ncbi:hypothetical protein Lepto7375DRAFT_1470 [Leptolyngbya sp. PCC 7375]|nr:hypothetical protein Lepto7375DRAFT_1470 [Leptolyngbya sp. PCC 7375]
MPSITTWNHLNMGLRVPNIDMGLEARIHDPLWMLARQYQLGEFYGEDAGSPIAVKAEMNVAPISRYHPNSTLNGGDAVSGQLLDSRTQPLEPLVEAESVHLRAEPTPRVGADTGLRLIRKLRMAGLETYVNGFIEAFPFTPIIQAQAASPDIATTLDAQAIRHLRILQNRIPDGRTLFTHFVPQVDQLLNQWNWPTDMTIATKDEQALRSLIIDWVTWYQQHYDEPVAGTSAWQPSRQEYHFAIAAHDGEQESVFKADDYYQGHLDWHAFKVAPAVSLGAQPSDPGPRFTQQIQTAVPAQLSYPGMPASRWWEMEDSQVDFGGIEGSTDIVRMLFVDYAISYSNDWYLVPLDVPYGTFSQVSSLVVTDVFGVQTTIPAVSAAADADGWHMYTITGSDDGLLLPPVVAQGLKSQPIEEVRFVRDEMANMAWGIEYLIESDAGTSLNRHETSRAGRIVPPPSATPDGALRYQLATTVPAHWIPFLPVRSGNSSADPLMLERGEMLPDSDLGGQTPTQVLGDILEPNLPSLQLFEEEVPRTGIRVTRAYQYARGADGKAHLWLGRRKTTARRGEVSSGLRFDAIVNSVS